MKPRRLQRKRTKGFRMADLSNNYVYCGRGSKWGNPFKAELYQPKDRKRIAKERYVEMIESGFPGIFHGIDFRWIRKHLHELRGKDLVCWCGLDEICHVDFLLSESNKVAK